MIIIIVLYIVQIAKEKIASIKSAYIDLSAISGAIQEHDMSISNRVP